MEKEQERLSLIVANRLKKIFNDTQPYIVEYKVDTTSYINSVRHWSWFVTFKMSKDYGYSSGLFCELANLLHTDFYRIQVKRGFLILHYQITEKGARELEKETQTKID